MPFIDAKWVVWKKKKLQRRVKEATNDLKILKLVLLQKKKGDGRIDICSLCLVYLLSLPVSSYAPMVMGVLTQTSMNAQVR